MAKKEKELADKNERLERLSKICGLINKTAFGGENHDAVMFLGSGESVEMERFPSGDPGLDSALGGGYPKGRFIELFGPESGGKSTLVLHAIAEHQRKYPDEDCALIDTEYTFDEAYAKRIGVNTALLIVNQPSSGEQALNILKLLMQNGVKCLAVDSVAALTTKAELEGDIGDLQVGQQARLMSTALRQLAAEAGKNNATVFWTNQMRDKIGVMYGDKTTTPAGHALRHYASIRLNVCAIGKVKEKLNGEDVVVSSKNKVTVKKNKCVAKGETIFVPGENKVYFVEELVNKTNFGVFSCNPQMSCVRTKAKKCVAQREELCVEVGVRGVGSLRTNFKHPYLTPNGYVEAGSLKVGDWVASVCKIPVMEKTNKYLTPLSARLLGLLCGDGATGGETGISLRNYSEGCIKEFVNACDKFGCEVYEKPDQKGLYVARKKDGGHKGKPSSLNSFLKKHDVFGKKAGTKEIPSRIFDSGVEIAGEFIGGLIATDGYVTKDGNGWCVGVSVVSRKLAEGLRHLFLQYGIKSSVTERKPRLGGVVYGRQIVGKKMAYEVRVRNANDVQKLKHMIHWSDGKMEKIVDVGWTEKTGEISWSRVKYVRDAGVIMTYDICESGFENFEIQGLITHNTAPPFRTAEFCISFGHGIDSIAAILDSAIALKVVSKKGAWFDLGTERLGQGRASILDSMRKDRSLTDRIAEGIKEAKKRGLKEEIAEDVEVIDASSTLEEDEKDVDGTLVEDV